MSDSTPQNDSAEQERLVSGMDDGTGDPNDDRAFLADTPPAQVDDEAVREHSEQTAEEEGTDGMSAGE